MNNKRSIVIPDRVVAEVKRRLNNGDKNKDIAKDFDLSGEMVSKIKNGRIYADVKPAVTYEQSPTQKLLNEVFR